MLEVHIFTFAERAIRFSGLGTMITLHGKMILNSTDTPRSTSVGRVVPKLKMTKSSIHQTVPSDDALPSPVPKLRTSFSSLLLGLIRVACAERELNNQPCYTAELHQGQPAVFGSSTTLMTGGGKQWWLYSHQGFASSCTEAHFVAQH